jgi:membrane protein YdbS with pleckstrin-like domain
MLKVKWFEIKGKDKKETLTNLSFLVIIIATLLICVGIGLGSFVKGIIMLASFGAFLLLVGIILFIVAEFSEEK